MYRSFTTLRACRNIDLTKVVIAKYLDDMCSAELYLGTVADVKPYAEQDCTPTVGDGYSNIICFN